MDWQMPEMDGFEATLRIRILEGEGELASGKKHSDHKGEELLRRLPIIGMTANAAPEHHEQCLKIGMDDCLNKPISLQGLRVALQRWVKSPDDHGKEGQNSLNAFPDPALSSGGLGPRDNSAGRSGQPVRGGESYDWNQALLFMEGDQDLLDSLFKIFAETAPRVLHTLEEAVVAEDRQTVLRCAHQLRGSFGALRAIGATEQASFIEKNAQSGDIDVLHKHVQALRLTVEKILTLSRSAG